MHKGTLQYVFFDGFVLQIKIIMGLGFKAI
jgi:hypothetical protein